MERKNYLIKKFPDHQLQILRGDQPQLKLVSFQTFITHIQINLYLKDYF